MNRIDAAGQPLPPQVRRHMEAFFAVGFSDVRIHVGTAAVDIGALAFTRGSDIFFAPGHYDPESARGRELLAHELTHVLQQRAGRVTNPCDIAVVVYDEDLEAEARRMGRLAAAYWPAGRARQTEYSVAAAALAGEAHVSSSNAGVVQCVFAGDLAAKTFEYFKKEAAMTFKDTRFEQVVGQVRFARGRHRCAEIAARIGTAAAARGTVGGRIAGAAFDSRHVDIHARAAATVPGSRSHAGEDQADPPVQSAHQPDTGPARRHQDLLTDPRGFAEGHVRANYDFVHSAASKETCAGYQATREYVYRINVPAMYCFTPPASASNITREPIIWANTPDRTLKNATKVAFDPRKPTDEVDLIFDIDLSMIDQYQKRDQQLGGDQLGRDQGRALSRSAPRQTTRSGGVR